MTGQSIIICAVCGYPGEEGTRTTSAGYELATKHSVRVCLRCHVETFDLLRWVAHRLLPHEALDLLDHMTTRVPYWPRPNQKEH